MTNYYENIIDPDSKLCFEKRDQLVSALAEACIESGLDLEVHVFTEDGRDPWFRVVGVEDPQSGEDYVFFKFPTVCGFLSGVSALALHRKEN